MHTGSTAHTQAPYSPPDGTVRLGSWLFKQRSWLPVPVALALLVVPASTHSRLLTVLGLCLVAAGEGLRLWAVHHIGAISRTRSQRLGPLIATGPFGRVRNPLYLGNIALWLGFTVSAGLPWLVPGVLLLLAVEYHAIVKWEEGLLVVRLGDPYRTYLLQVPRWVPSWRAAAASRALLGGYSWRETLFSERGTLIAIVVGLLLLGAKGALRSGNWTLGAGG
jgi:protein-S-isoprenylcysteine O-methyltransferase Ste14